MNNKVSHSLPGGTFVVDARYVPQRVIGTGAYGVVCAARDSVTGTDVITALVLFVLEWKKEEEKKKCSLTD